MGEQIASAVGFSVSTVPSNDQYVEDAPNGRNCSNLWRYTSNSTMRPAVILLIGLLVTIAAFTIEWWAKWVALGVAALPLFLIILGQFRLPKSRQSIRLWLNPEVAENIPELTLRLNGREITFDYFKRWYEFEIAVRKWWLLGLIAISSMSAVALVWRLRELPIPGSFYYYACVAWIPFCSLAARWLKERSVMGRCELSLASFRVEPSSGFWKRVRYKFVDSQGSYWGDSFRTPICNSADNLSVAFYLPNNPQQSVIASALVFHDLKWAGSEPSERERARALRP